MTGNPVNAQLLTAMGHVLECEQAVMALQAHPAVDDEVSRSSAIAIARRAVKQAYEQVGRDLRYVWGIEGVVPATTPEPDDTDTFQVSVYRMGTWPIGGVDLGEDSDEPVQALPGDTPLTSLEDDS